MTLTPTARVAIAEQARLAAQKWAGSPQGALAPVNPYPWGSHEHSAWNVDFQRWLLRFSSGDDVEVGA